MKNGLAVNACVKARGVCLKTIALACLDSAQNTATALAKRFASMADGYFVVSDGNLYELDPTWPFQSTQQLWPSRRSADPFWWCKGTTEPELANMEWVFLKKDGIKIPCLQNCKPLAKEEQLMFLDTKAIEVAEANKNRKLGHP